MLWPKGQYTSRNVARSALGPARGGALFSSHPRVSGCFEVSSLSLEMTAAPSGPTFFLRSASAASFTQRDTSPSSSSSRCAM